MINTKEERYNIIKQLCIIQLRHSKKLNAIHKAISSNREAFGNMDDCFAYEMFSVDLTDLIFDIMFLPKDNTANYDLDELYDNNLKHGKEYPDDLFCRDSYYDIWASHVEGSDGLEEDLVIESFINVIEREVDEININMLYGEK